jgi:hypothetical protein
MSWTEEDVNRIQAKYGEGAIVTKEDGTLQVKIDENKIDRQRFLEVWMSFVSNEVDGGMISDFIVTAEEGADMEIIKASAEKHGLRLQAIPGEVNRYQIARKD